MSSGQARDGLCAEMAAMARGTACKVRQLLVCCASSPLYALTASPCGMCCYLLL